MWVLNLGGIEKCLPVYGCTLALLTQTRMIYLLLALPLPRPNNPYRQIFFYLAKASSFVAAIKVYCIAEYFARFNFRIFTIWLNLQNFNVLLHPQESYSSNALLVGPLFQWIDTLVTLTKYFLVRPKSLADLSGTISSIVNSRGHWSMYQQEGICSPHFQFKCEWWLLLTAQ